MKYGFSKTARIASALTVALTVIVVVALLEAGRGEVHTAGHASTQPQSDADSHNGQLSNPLPVVTAHSAAAPTESEQRPLAGPPTAADTQQPVDGVAAAQAVDWDKVKTFAPIPRSLPTRQAADAVDAGFVPEWFEHSIGGWTTRGAPIDGKVNAIGITELASRIMSAPKDAWGQGLETQLRSIVASKLPGDAQVISREFCSSEGCLCYLEDTDLSKHTRPTESVTHAVLNDPQSRAYGITSQTYYVTGSGGWDLILISRTKPVVR